MSVGAQGEGRRAAENLEIVDSTSELRRRRKFAKVVVSASAGDKLGLAETGEVMNCGTGARGGRFRARHYTDCHPLH